MIFERDILSSVLKKLIKLLELPPGSPGGAAAASVRALSTGLGAKGAASPEMEIRLLSLLSSLARLLTEMESHGIKPDHTVDLCFLKLRNSLSFAAAGRFAEARAENDGALKELSLARKQINSESGRFIRTVKFDTIYSQLASLFDAAGRLAEPAKKERK